MFFGYLQDLFYRHATVYRAITVEEYREGIIYSHMVQREFDKICRHWNRASQRVDLRSMAYTVELFEYIAHLPHFDVARSGWEFRRKMEPAGVFMAAVTK